MTAKDNLVHYMNKLNYTFTTITKDYNYISSNFTKLLNCDIIPYDNLTDLDISMNDLSINLQTLLFMIEHAVMNDTNDTNVKEQINKNQEQYEKQKKTDLLVDTTLTKMLPIFLLCLMMFDKESILNFNSFGKNSSKIDETLNGLPNMTMTMAMNSLPDLNYDIYIPELD